VSNATDRHMKRLEQMIDDTPQEWVHPWMYSFMMGDYVQFDHAAGSDNANGIYLVAYCKNCRKGLTALLDRGFSIGETRITDLDIPKYGCVAPS
jgi:hypothetical protein